MANTTTTEEAGGERSSRVGHLGFGSNVGDPPAQIGRAIELLASHGIGIEAISSLYVTEPVGEILDQPDFFNAAARISTVLEPIELLDLCKEVERDLGREGDGVRHGPRPIDIDVLLLGDLGFSHERLALPHPEVSNRRFVLVPLLEIDPDLTLPGGTRLDVLLEALGPGQRVSPYQP